ncbi:MAG TPA: hypothetical protein VN777_08705 [Terriglobales bacterium]|nr:hypothetical protein [Terriglobales bacterium]
MKNAKKKKVPAPFVMASLFALSCLVVLTATAAPAAMQGDEFQPTPAAGTGNVIVTPKFGGAILGYDIERSGTEGLLSEYITLSGGDFFVATETFSQKTGAILKVVAKENQTQDDYVTQGIFGNIGLDLFQHAGQNHFLTINPLDGGKFTGKWTPPIKPNYQLWTTSVSQGTPNVAAYQSSFDTGLTYVFSSNIADNTFGRQISLKPIINVDEFFHPQIALDSVTNQAVLADSPGCPEPDCVSSIALVDLNTGKISKFSDNLGVGTVNGLAVDSEKGIACTTTLSDGGVEFYDLAKKTGFAVQIANYDGTPLDSGLDVEFDPIHHVFLISQWSSNGGNVNDPQPQVYVYDEEGNLKETIPVQRLPINPVLIALNPGKRIGFLPVIVQAQGLELQSFTY